MTVGDEPRQITTDLNDPYFFGGTRSALVPGVFDVALNGRPYMLDLQDFPGEWRHDTVTLIRQQADAAPSVGEHTLNVEDLWRRSIDSWHKGAGQRYYDQPDSDPARFYRSDGIDCWTRGDITLLGDTERIKESTEPNLAVVVAGGRLYMVDGTDLEYATALEAPSWTAVTGTAIAGAVSVTTNGSHIFFADTVDTYSHDAAGAATYATYMTSAAPGSLLRWVKGRLLHAGIGADRNVLSEITGAAGAGVLTEILTHANPAWVWTDVAEGANVIYASGYAGDRSLVYRIGITADGVELGAPVVAAQLPEGEVVMSMFGYLGFLMLGTTKGVRFAAPATADGDLTLGRVIAVASPPRAWEGQDRFVWFGWTDYGPDRTGLGRLDLSVLNDGDVPGWASDLMAATAGVVTSVVTYDNRRVFTVAESGLWTETDDRVPEGRIESGVIAFNLSESKTALYVVTRWGAGAGTFQISMAVDDGPYSPVGAAQTTSATTAGGSDLTTAQKRGDGFEVRYLLRRSATDAPEAPVIRRWTLKVDPSAPRRVRINVPLRLHTWLTDDSGQTYPCDVDAERSHIEYLAENRQVCAYQEGLRAYSVVVDDYHWIPYRGTDAPRFSFDGTLLVTLKTV